MPFKLYESSAGSGKTYTLVKEYIKIILRRRDFNSILAITFTNQAAKEMKKRIILYLKSLAEGNRDTLFLDLEKELPDIDIQSRAKYLLVAILHNYSDFKITTIDSFIHKVVRQFTFELKLPLYFEVDLQEKLIAKRIEDMLLEKAGNNSVVTELFLHFLEHKIEEEEKIKGQHKNTNLRNIIDNSLKTISSQVFKENNNKFLSKAKKSNIFERVENKNLLDDFNTKVKEAIDIVNDYYYKKDLSKRAITELKKLSNPSSLQKINIDKIEKERWPKKGKENFFNHFWNQEFGKVINEVIYLYKKNIKILDKHISSLLYISIYQMTLIKIFKELLKEYIDSTNTVPNSILNQRVANIIKKENTPFIYYKIGEKFHNYLIDEFQDTSTLHWGNLLPLIQNSLAEGYLNIAVGDVKQSIYRWRGGDVKIMTEFLEKDLGREVKRISLDSNYRSSINIVKFNNIFFKRAAETLDDKVINLIYKNNEQKIIKKSNGYVEIKIYNQIERERKDIKKLIIHNLIEQIDELIARGIVSLSDIAILVRNNQEGKEIAQKLFEAGIDVVSSDSLLIEKEPVIKLLIYALKWLVNPNNKKDEITMFFLFNELKEINNNLFEKLENIKLDKNLDNEIFTQKELKNFKEKREFLLGLSLYSLIEELIKIFKLKDIEKESSRFLIRFLDAIIDSKSDNLLDFLDWWKNMKGSISLAIPENFNGVKIMTIHKSKGLQFPVVFVPFVSWNTSINSRYPIWLENKNDKLNYILYPKTDFSKSNFANGDFKKSYLEEKDMVMIDNLNLLYVAFTRAIDFLFVSSYNTWKDSIAHIIYDNLFKKKNVVNLNKLDKDLVFKAGEIKKVSESSFNKFEKFTEFNIYPTSNFLNKK